MTLSEKINSKDFYDQLPGFLDDSKIAVIGLGYVGLPLALALAQHFTVVGFDTDKERIENLREGYDRNREVRQPELIASPCVFTHEIGDLDDAHIYIVTVPTPLAENNKPDLSLIEKASASIAPLLSEDNIVVYESTVYPGVTENICGPILQEGSNLVCGQNFYLGYSPERINPGDRDHSVDTITKVVAGQNVRITDILADLYGRVNNGNIYRASSIQVAEASKAIENAQRDINVAFINEVTKIVNDLNLSVYDVLDAAATKWNFLKFTPGLVGGHCIGVDPYYMAHCAKELGRNPDVILAGRQTNDDMGVYFAERLTSFLKEDQKDILILGFTFKENINDIRNTRVIDIYHSLLEAGCDVDIHDPMAEAALVKKEYGLSLLPRLPEGRLYDCVILAVPHEQYKLLKISTFKALLKPQGLFYDLKGLLRDCEFGPDHQYLCV